MLVFRRLANYASAILDEYRPMTTNRVFRALANENRMRILAWLKNPTGHFPPQKDGDLVHDGVCGLLICCAD